MLLSLVTKYPRAVLHRLPLAGAPSTKRTIVNVANHQGVMNIGADNVHLQPVDLYHSPASGQGLPEGKLGPVDKGSMDAKGTPAKHQPQAFGQGAPQVTPSAQAALLYGGWKNSPSLLKVYAVFANGYAAEQIDAAVKNQASNDYVTYVDKAMSFSSLNAKAMGGADTRALQFTPKAIASKEFVVQYREANEVERGELSDQMKETAKKLLPGNGLLREVKGSANEALNSQIKANE